MDDFISCRSREQRRPMWTQHEKTVLRILMRQYAGVSEFDPPDIHKHPIKNEMWRLLTIRYNSQTNVRTRDAKQLRKAWENLKYRARKISADRDFSGKLKSKDSQIHARISEDNLLNSSSEIIFTQADDVGSSTIEEEPILYSSVYDSDEVLVTKYSPASEEDATYSDDCKTSPNYCDSTSKVENNLSENSDADDSNKNNSDVKNIFSLSQWFPFMFANPTACMTPFPFIKLKSKNNNIDDFEECCDDNKRNICKEVTEPFLIHGQCRHSTLTTHCEDFTYGKQLLKDNLHLLRDKIRQQEEGHRQMMQLLQNQKLHAEEQHEIKMKSLHKQLTFWCKQFDALDCLPTSLCPVV